MHGIANPAPSSSDQLVLLVHGIATPSPAQQSQNRRHEGATGCQLVARLRSTAAWPKTNKRRKGHAAIDTGAGIPIEVDRVTSSAELVLRIPRDTALAHLAAQISEGRLEITLIGRGRPTTWPSACANHHRSSKCR